MPTYEELIAAGAKPAAPAAPPAGMTYEQLIAAGAQPPAAPAAPPELSATESFAANASNVFGAAPVISGVIRHLTEGVPYAQARDQYQQQIIDASKEQHPTASTAGSIASLVPETVLGGAVGKAAGAISKAAGLAAKAEPLVKAHPLITKALEGAAGGAAYGAASGAGSAASHGQDVLPAAAESAVGGGVLGGVLGGAAAKVGDVLSGGIAKQNESFVRGAAEVLSGGIAKQNESFVRGAAERALPKKQGALAALIEDSEDIKGVAKKASIGVDDVLQENRDILGGARSNDYDTVAKTRSAIEDKVSSYEGAKKEAYNLVDQATKGGVDAGDLTESLKNKAARETERPYRKVLLNKAAQLEEDYASISTDEAKKRLVNLAPTPGAREAVANYVDTLPEGKQWTTKDFLNHLAGDEKSTNFDPNIRKAIESLPYKFDPALKIPSQEVRALLTSSQDEAESALGTLNATKNAKLAAQNQAVIGQVMNKALDSAKKSDVEGIVDAVQSIHDTNLRQSVLLRLNEGLATKEDKLKLGKLGLGGTGSKLLAADIGGRELLGGVGKIASGDFGGAALDAGKAALAFATPKVLAKAKPAATDLVASGNRVLQRLNEEAARGNPKAINLLKSMQAAKTIGTAGAGAIGSVSSGTLGQGQ